MEPKKSTKNVSHQEHQGHKDHQNLIVYASSGFATLFLLYMPPAAVQFIVSHIIKSSVQFAPHYRVAKPPEAYTLKLIHQAAGGLYNKILVIFVSLVLLV